MWREIENFASGKKCDDGREGDCGHTGCRAAERVRSLAAQRTGAAETIVWLLKKRCFSAQQGQDCGHSACGQVVKFISFLRQKAA